MATKVAPTYATLVLGFFGRNILQIRTEKGEEFAE